MSEDEQAEIVNLIAANPKLGDIMLGTGGARKVRVDGRGKGKSGGYRIVSYHAGEDVPILLLALIDKGERANLSKAERNELRQTLMHYADDYRRSSGARQK